MSRILIHTEDTDHTCIVYNLADEQLDRFNYVS